MHPCRNWRRDEIRRSLFHCQLTCYRRWHLFSIPIQAERVVAIEEMNFTTSGSNWKSKVIIDFGFAFCSLISPSGWTRINSSKARVPDFLTPIRSTSGSLRAERFCGFTKRYLKALSLRLSSSVSDTILTTLPKMIWVSSDTDEGVDVLTLWNESL